MEVKSLSLKGFRCHTSFHLPFSNGVHCIFGENAQGKTSLLEALFLFVAGRSFRCKNLPDLIQHEASCFHARMLFNKHGMEEELVMGYDGKQRFLEHNGTALPSLTALLGIFHAVILSPVDIALVRGGPQGRRHYLDLLLSQSDPVYLSHLSRYARALRQRNQLLRNKQEHTLDVWESEMAQSAVHLVKRRQEVVQELAEEARMMLTRIAGDSELLTLDYRSGIRQQGDVQCADFYAEHWKRSRTRDIHVRHTSAGPHRDDMHILIGGREARSFASEGQVQSIVAALRFAEWMRLKSFVKTNPVMLVDELGASLDNHRRQRVLDLFQDMGQVMMTAASPWMSENLGQLIEVSKASKSSGRGLLVSENITN